MVTCIDSSPSAFVLADRPVLVESSSAYDRRLIRTDRGVDVVNRAVTRDGAFVCCTRAGVIGPKVFNNVIFDERARGPTINREVRITIGGIRATVCNIPIFIKFVSQRLKLIWEVRFECEM